VAKIDNGAYTQLTQGLSGNIGGGQTAGTGKQIIYDPVHNNNTFFHRSVQFEVKAIVTTGATSVSVAGTGGATTITANKGSLQMLATVLPQNADDNTVTWSIEGEAFGASINSNGLLTASGTSSGNGTIIVKATANDGTGHSGSKAISISGQVTSVSSITITGGTAITADGGNLQLTANVLPADASNQTVTWSFVGENFGATLNNGLLTASGTNSGNGTVTVKTTAQDGSGVFDEQNIAISGQEEVMVNSITISGGTEITVDGGTLQLTASVLPANADDNTVTWSIEGESLGASVTSAGLLNAGVNGTILVKATANDGSGIFAQQNITISEQTVFVTSISIVATSGPAFIYSDEGSLQLSASVLPDNADNNTVTWSIEGSSYGATISLSGLLTASGVTSGNGLVTVKATANDDSGSFSTRNINIFGQIDVANGGGVTDIDGNSYTSVILGNQEWMTQNLKVIKYPNGTAIPHVTDNTSWANLLSNNTDDAYCYYNNNANGEKDTYGALYTWATAMGDNAASSDTNPSGVQGICPNGWHLPSDAEWTELSNYLGGVAYTGGKMKEIGTTHWSSPNEGATNESGFFGLPSGARGGSSGSFANIELRASWYTATQGVEFSIAYNNDDLLRSLTNKDIGFSVRCVKNN